MHSVQVMVVIVGQIGQDLDFVPFFGEGLVLALDVGFPHHGGASCRYVLGAAYPDKEEVGIHSDREVGDVRLYTTVQTLSTAGVDHRVVTYL